MRDGMTHDIATIIANLQKEVQSIRDLASVTPAAEHRESLLETAKLVEQCIREYDRNA
jgi:hypothetical protein